MGIPAGPAGAANDPGRVAAVSTVAEKVLKAAARNRVADPAARVTYLLLAYAPDRDSHIDRLFIQVAGGGTRGLRAGEHEEPATVAGLASQLMRQNAELHRLLISAQEGRAEMDGRMHEPLAVSACGTARHATSAAFVSSSASCSAQMTRANRSTAAPSRRRRTSRAARQIGDAATDRRSSERLLGRAAVLTQTATAPGWPPRYV